MIEYEQKGNVPSLIHGESSSSSPYFRNTNENNFQPKVIMSPSWCNFCEESTCEVKKSAKDKILGKNPETTIVVLDWAELKDVMIINTRNKSYASKGKYDPPRTSSSPSSSGHRYVLIAFKITCFDLFHLKNTLIISLSLYHFSLITFPSQSRFHLLHPCSVI
jgi:hypothetical protein